MILLKNFVQVIEKYAVFEGRASCSEFWWFVLALLIIAFIVGLAFFPLFFIPYAFNVVTYAFILAIFTMTLAVTVRRLHDTGRSAWWLLSYVPAAIYDLVVFVDVPAVNAFMLPVDIISRLLEIVLIVFMALPGNGRDSRYGADPR